MSNNKQVKYGEIMANFEYKAKDTEGKPQSGTMTASSMNQVYEDLRAKGLLVVSVSEVDELPAAKKGAVSNKKIKLNDVVVFCRQFSSMMEAGITVIKCLDILYRQTESKELKAVLLRIYETIKKGGSLSGSMRDQGRAFPPLLVSMIESGEASGRLDEVLTSMAVHYEKEKALNNKVKAAMVYPITLGVVATIVVLVLMTAVVPVFVDLVPDPDNIPTGTQILLGISDFIIDYWYIVLAGYFGLFFAGTHAMRTPSIRIKIDGLLLKIPVFGKLQKIVITARFARTVSSLYGGGVAILECIRIAGSVMGNLYIQNLLTDVTTAVKQGTPFSKALTDIDVFPAMFCSMVYIGEESGSLESILEKTANFYDEDSQAAIGRMVALLEPIMLMVMGAVVGAIVVVIFQTMQLSYDYM